MPQWWREKRGEKVFCLRAWNYARTFQIAGAPRNWVSPAFVPSAEGRRN